MLKTHVSIVLALAVSVVGCAAEPSNEAPEEPESESVGTVESALGGQCKPAQANCTNAVRACEAAVIASWNTPINQAPLDTIYVICSLSSYYCQLAGAICRCEDRKGIGC